MHPIGIGHPRPKRMSLLFRIVRGDWQIVVYSLTIVVSLLGGASDSEHDESPNPNM